MMMGGYLKQPSEVIAQEFVPRLHWDLKVLTLLLEQYLIDEKTKLKVQKQPIIEGIKVGSIISYNYTNTFQRLYDTNHNIPVHFIHGQLGKHNLVLGIGETLPDGLENQFTVCANFKKFFQRVKYRLGNQYRSITKNKDSRIIPWQVVIYGHSLDPTDKDSLYWLMKKLINKMESRMLVMQLKLQFITIMRMIIITKLQMLYRLSEKMNFGATSRFKAK